MAQKSKIEASRRKGKARLFLGVYFKITIMLFVVLIFASAEIMLALHYKSDLKEDFNKVSSFDEKERGYHAAILNSSELAHEVSIINQDFVFLKVGLWLRHLRQLSKFEEELAVTKSEHMSFAQLASVLENDLKGIAREAELKDFAEKVKKKLKFFNDQLRVQAQGVREYRKKVVEEYGRKSDRYSFVLLLLGATGVAIVFIPSLIFFRGVVHAINEIKNQTVLIAEGNYDERLPDQRDDEIGELLVAINKMAHSLEVREKEKEDSQLRMFQQDKMYTIGSFAAGIAHEVGNPIQAMMALTSQTIEELCEKEDDKEIERAIDNLSLVMEQIERLGRVVRDVREFSHTGEEKFEYASINDIVNSAIRLLRFDKRFDRIELTTILDDIESPVYLNVDHLTQLIINLTVNAADAIEHDDGKVLIVTKFKGDEVLIRVSDNGKGMTQHESQHAFDEFFTTKKKGKGTGLGLSVCKQIAQECDGKITLKSVVGKGTTFSVHLPVKKNDEATGDDE